MKKSVNEVVYELTGKQDEKILGMNTTDLIEQVILPEIVRPTGQDTRGWRISDDYMYLIADYGHELWDGDCYRGGFLYEIAMQRISCGAVLHEATRVLEALPGPYRKYSTYFDQPGLMSGGCLHFLTEQAETVLKFKPEGVYVSASASALADHMEKILFGIIDQLDETGKALTNYMLGREIDGAKVFLMAWITLRRCRPETLWRHCAGQKNWRRWTDFLREQWYCIDHDEFARLIGLSGPFKAWRAKRKLFA